MTAVDVASSHGAVDDRRSLLALPGYLVLLAIVAWWAWRAFHDPITYDTGLAYLGGQVAWASGHPEHLATWISTPFLGFVMAIASQILSVTAAAHVVTAINVVLVVATLILVLGALRPLLSRLWWWAVAIGLSCYGPMMSSVWWKQFNIIAFVPAVAGFELIRRKHPHRGAALIGLSVAIKPLAIVLPFVLLARKETRRAGAWALGWFAGLNVVAQAFMAFRAHSFAALNVIPMLQNFMDKSKPANLWSCVAENFAPGSLLCRLVGGSNWTVQHFIVWGAVALFALWVVDALRGRSATAWECFAFVCPLSVMVSPIAWSHYQIMLAPLFVLLVYRFSREGAGVSAWAGLAAAFLLASLMWQPYGTLISAVRSVVSAKVATEKDLLSVEAVAEFAQYVLVITGMIWYFARPARSRTPPTSASAP